MTALPAVTRNGQLKKKTKEKKIKKIKNENEEREFPMPVFKTEGNFWKRYNPHFRDFGVQSYCAVKNFGKKTKQKKKQEGKETQK